MPVSKNVPRRNAAQLLVGIAFLVQRDIQRPGDVVVAKLADVFNQSNRLCPVGALSQNKIDLFHTCSREIKGQLEGRTRIYSRLNSVGKAYPVKRRGRVMAPSLPRKAVRSAVAPTGGLLAARKATLLPNSSL